jgi:hypothetical protein
VCHDRSERTTERIRSRLSSAREWLRASERRKRQGMNEVAPCSKLWLTTLFKQLFYVIKIIYTIGVAFYKLTFLIQFWRIFRSIYYMRILYIVAIVLISGWSISQILVTIMTCLPIWSNWEQIDPTSATNIVCLPVWVSTYLNAGGTVLTDLIVLLLPVPTLWSLRLRRSQKWAAVGIFGIGGM